MSLCLVARSTVSAQTAFWSNTKEAQTGTKVLRGLVRSTIMSHWNLVKVRLGTAIAEIALEIRQLYGEAEDTRICHM